MVKKYRKVYLYQFLINNKAGACNKENDFIKIHPFGFQETKYTFRTGCDIITGGRSLCLSV